MEVEARYARWDGVGRPFSIRTHRTAPSLGLGEILVEIDLATVCGSDLHTVSGRPPSPAPGVLGHEQVGTVLAAGQGAAAPVGAAGRVVGHRVLWPLCALCPGPAAEMPGASQVRA